MIRVLHLSDVHVDVPVMGMPIGTLLNKRMLGAANLMLRRARHFNTARDKLTTLARFAEREGVDLVVCTGDYTALGTEPEMVAARAAIDPLTRRPRGFVTVPGNHDLYLHDSVFFERLFGDLLGSDWPEHVVEGGTFPAVRLYDEHLAVITVNSARTRPVSISKTQMPSRPSWVALPAPHRCTPVGSGGGSFPWMWPWRSATRGARSQIASSSSAFSSPWFQRSGPPSRRRGA